MSIDERIEALTQTVKRLASMHQDHKQKFEERQKQIDQMFQAMATQFQRRDEQFWERFKANEALIARRDEQFNERFRAMEALIARRDEQFDGRFEALFPTNGASAPATIAQLSEASSSTSACWAKVWRAAVSVMISNRSNADTGR